MRNDIEESATRRKIVDYVAGLKIFIVTSTAFAARAEGLLEGSLFNLRTLAESSLNANVSM